MKPKQTPENLEKLIKETFCNLDSIVSCAYHTQTWCEETCGIYTKSNEQVKYGNRVK